MYLCALLFACAPGVCLGQQQAARDYPSKPIRLLVPYPAGGGVDIIAHTVGQKLARLIGQNLFVDNRGGAGGAIGTEIVAKSPPDGYTILIASSAHASLPSIYKSLPYDAVRDFTPITLVARSVGLVLVVHPSLPTRSIRDLVSLAKAHPGKLNYASGGTGSVTHFAAELLNQMAGIRITHVPYKGLGPGIIDCVAGRIEMCFVAATAGVPYIRSGKLRALGITGTVRWSELADVPTIDEAGVKGYAYMLWYGMWFPAGTPNEYVTRIRAEVARAFEDPEAKRKFGEEGLISVASTPQEFGKAIHEQVEIHRKLAAWMGLAPQ